MSFADYAKKKQQERGLVAQKKENTSFVESVSGIRVTGNTGGLTAGDVFAPATNRITTSARDVDTEMSRLKDKRTESQRELNKWSMLDEAYANGGLGAKRLKNQLADSPYKSTQEAQADVDKYNAQIQKLADDPLRVMALCRGPVIKDQHGSLGQLTGGVGNSQGVRGVMAGHPGGVFRQSGTILKFRRCHRKI